jgi:putative glutathione S-transferase
MSASKSSQGTRVQKELDQLRLKQLAKNQRDKLKDCRLPFGGRRTNIAPRHNPHPRLFLPPAFQCTVTCSPLTTPEDAQAFLASMRDKQHLRENLHKPPSNLSSDGMDAWYMLQRQKERELKARRKEAEMILRGYRGSGSNSYFTPTNADLSESTMTESETVFNYDAVVETPRMAQFDEKKEEEELAEKADFLDEEKKDESAFVSRSLNSGRNSMGRPNSQTTPLPTMGLEDGEETVWRDFISNKPDAKFPPEAGRYHLYCSYACPGSHRVLIIRALKGLENVISVTFLHPVWRLTNPEDDHDKHRGWVFGDPKGVPFSNTIGKGGPFPPSYPGNDPDPNFNGSSIREIYEFSQDTSGKYTIPLLWDTKLNTIVNNESSDISYMLNSSFNEFAAKPDLDLYTEDDVVGKAKLHEVSTWLSPLMIHGVYRCGFAKTQWAYDRAINDLCAAFDRADDILEGQRYLTGDTLTDADIRLFVTLIRFDEVYAVYFKANARLVMLTPSLLNFCRDLYQLPGIRETCNMDQIKAHFYASHAEWNKYSVIPRGLGFLELLDMPHDRETLLQAVMSSDSADGRARPSEAEQWNSHH